MSDHAAEAITYSNLAYENRANPTYQGFADLAQLHATLALVEQQRIANLIALAQRTDVGVFESVLDDEGYVEGTRVAAPIREALGLS